MNRFLLAAGLAAAQLVASAALAQTAAPVGEGSGVTTVTPKKATASERAKARADRHAAGVAADKTAVVGEADTTNPLAGDKKVSREDRKAAGVARRAEMRKEVKNGEVQVVGDDRAKPYEKK